jgi:hypothetical protein
MSRAWTLDYAGQSVSITESRTYYRRAVFSWTGQDFGAGSTQNITFSQSRHLLINDVRQLDGVDSGSTSQDTEDFTIVALVPRADLTFDRYNRPSGLYSINVLRLSNNLLALSADNAAAGQTLIKPLCPTGALPPITAARPAPVTYSAYNPITGEADLFAAAPVNWS